MGVLHSRTESNSVENPLLTFLSNGPRSLHCLDYDYVDLYYCLLSIEITKVSVILNLKNYRHINHHVQYIGL